MYVKMHTCIMNIVKNVLQGKFYVFPVCEITFETWADTLSGHNKICMDGSGVVLKFIKLYIDVNQQFSSSLRF